MQKIIQKSITVLMLSVFVLSANSNAIFALADEYYDDNSGWDNGYVYNGSATYENAYTTPSTAYISTDCVGCNTHSIS